MKTWRAQRFIPSSRTTSPPFLGRKLSPQFEGEMGNRFNIRIEGTRIKHTMGPVSIKLYDKFGLILRIETTVNELTFFKHYREVEHRDGLAAKWASMQKTIYSLPALRELLEAANRRYLEFLSAIEDPRAGRNKLDKLSQPVEQEGRRYSGFNLFDPDDENLLCSIVRGEFNISGLQNKTLRLHLPERSSSQVSRLLKRLRTQLVKKVGHTYKYYVTAFGKEVVATALKLRQLVIIPQLALRPRSVISFSCRETADLLMERYYDQEYAFLCKPLASVQGRGEIDRGTESPRHGALMARYIARWAHNFLGLTDDSVLSDSRR